MQQRPRQEHFVAAHLGVKACGSVDPVHDGPELWPMVAIVPHIAQEQCCVDHLMQQGVLEVTDWAELQPHGRQASMHAGKQARRQASHHLAERAGEAAKTPMS